MKRKQSSEFTSKKKITRVVPSSKYLDPDPDFNILDDASLYACLMFLNEEFGLSNWDEYIHRRKIQVFQKNGFLNKEDRQLAIEMLTKRVKVLLVHYYFLTYFNNSITGILIGSR